MSDPKAYYSHYDQVTGKGKKLEQHLREVAEAARDSVPPSLDFDGIDCWQVKTLLQWQARFHDLGKYTDFFQKYLLEGQYSSFQNHAHISALALYGYLKERTAALGIDRKTSEVLCFLFYVMVRRHHGSLTTEGLFRREDLPRMKRECNAQANSLLERKEVLSDAVHLSEKETEQLLLDLPNLLENKKFTRSMRRIRMNYAHERWYFFMIYCFSQLVDKDKSSAADLRRRNRSALRSELVSGYIDLKSKGQHSNMNQKREQVRQTVLHRIDNLSDREIRNIRIFTLTAPTGIGKTLTSMQAAFRLSERLESIYAYNPKIITAIPFINIIEQTKKDYAEVLKDEGLLNIHHRLADKRLGKDRSGKQEIPIEKAMLEVESWEGDVILTTFVQFFQSLFTGNNARLIKINKLAGSIVILDEVQSIPEKYMPLVGAALMKLSQYFGTRFILMSATQPYLLEMGQKLLEQCASESANGAVNGLDVKSLSLLPDYADYYRFQARTKLVPSFRQILDTDTFIDFFEQTWAGRSAVVVVNTIQRCIDIYSMMKDRLGGEAFVCHLSTNLVPKERKRVINEVKAALESGETVILVSTQTIEAGVDLDFEVGYRDLAPLESIVQTAGRVNRNGNLKRADGETEACPVYIVHLEKDHQWIYQLHHMDCTKRLLQQYGEIAEPDYLQIIDTYYRQMANCLSQESIDIWEEGIMKLDFSKVQQFQLIPEDQQAVDVFVELDDDAEKLADAYEMIRSSAAGINHELLEEVTGEKVSPESLSPFRRKALIRLILGRMGEYMVQVRYQRLQKTRPLSFSERGGVESSFYWVPLDQLSDFYDIETGYGGTEEARIW